MFVSVLLLRILLLAISIVLAGFILNFRWLRKQFPYQARPHESLSKTYARFRVYYATKSGTSLRIAQRIAKEINEFLNSNDMIEPCAVVLPITDIDVDKFAIADERVEEERFDTATYSLDTKKPNVRASSGHMVLNVFVVSTYENGTPAPSARKAFEAIVDMSHDFRLSGDEWKQHQFAIFGCGSKKYGRDFNRFAVLLHEALSRKGGNSIVRKVFKSDTDTHDKDVKDFVTALKSHFSGRQGSANSIERATSNAHNGDSQELDIEDVVGEDDGAEDEMINPRIRQGLTKQGYKLFGTHSGVKLCRWTKSMIRGHGGCYKHTFYGISSLACMEMTPSLACANQCVFCWRHHTNPTTREWRWKHDPPEFVISSALEGHRRMLKVLRGVPGVTEERLHEAMKVRHCALSLVGEPIIYPEINKLINLMHQNDISTFLVTNAQFPEKIRQLPPGGVTQLYVSVDAGDKESLKAIDRPVFEDFWDRYLESIRMLSLKKQRTVFRLTLVKNYNVTEIEGYVKLVHIGSPSFLEVKGVTYCGDNGEDGISMRNVPYHHEVVDFCQVLQQQLDGEYEIACEHEHSCCVLLAKKDFKINGKWHTWIDYDKFFELVRDGIPFTAMDYLAPTPEWGVFGAAEKGFDPTQVKKKSHHRGPVAGGC